MGDHTRFVKNNILTQTLLDILHGIHKPVEPLDWNDGMVGFVLKMTQTKQETLELAKLAFEEGQKGLSDQDQTISSIRQRSIWIGGLAGVIANFLGVKALECAPLSDISWSVDSAALIVGFVSLCAVYVAIFYIIRPRGNLFFFNNPSSIIDQFIEGPNATNLTDTYKVLARFSEEHFGTNKATISNLFNWLFVAVLSMFLEFVAWVIVLA